MSRIERLRGGPWPVVLYAVLAVFSFPVLEHVVFGQTGVAYALDVFDLQRTGVSADWLANGPTLWNTHIAAGNALLAQQANTPFAIDVGLAFFVGPFNAYVVMSWLMATVAGISMHLFLRDSLRLSTVAVVGGGVLYLFGFWIWIYGVAAPAIPLLFWLVDRAIVPGPRRWRFVLGGGLVGGVVLYHGLSQIVLIVAGVLLAYVVVVSPGRHELTRRVATWAGIWAIAFGLYAPVLLTQLVLIPISNRTIWDLETLYETRPVQAVGEAVRHYSAVFVGVPVGGGFGLSPARYGTYFLGAIGLPLAALGIVRPTWDRRRLFLVALLVAIPLIDLITVLLTPLLESFGPFRSFQFVRIRHVLPFALVATAAYGLDLVATTLLAGRRLQLPGRWRWAVVIASLVPLAVTAVAIGRQLVRRRDDLPMAGVADVGWVLAGVAFVVGAVTVGWLVLVWIRSPRDGARPVGWIVVAAFLVLLVGERVAYTHGERLTGGQLGTWEQQVARTPGQEFILDQPGSDIERVLSFGEISNRMAAVGLLQVDGNQAIVPLMYHTYFGLLIAPQLAVDPDRFTYYHAWGNRTATFGPRVDPELVALAGARWLYVRGDDVPTVPGIVPRFRDGDVTVYEVPQVLPRAFVAGSIEVGRDASEVEGRLAAADLESLAGTVFLTPGPEADVLSAELGPDPAAGSAGTARIVEYTPDRVTIDVAADRPGVLVLTDVMAPGWVAQVDGATVPIATVDVAFRGVAVGPATRRVVFTYAPTFTYVGFAIAGGTLVGTILLAWFLRQRDRRDHATLEDTEAGPAAG